jgi:hypothetical protein
VTSAAAVIAKHRENVGFREGANNENPWGRIQGIPNAAYCDSGASVVPFQQGYSWWEESQFKEKGSAYCPFHIAVGVKHGAVAFDHASAGQPADVKAGDLLFYDWNNDGVADHVETAVEDCPSGGRTHNIGYNTGSPEGCWELWRDRRFLLCRLRPNYIGNPTPTPTPTPRPVDQGPPFPGRVLKRALSGEDVRTYQARLIARGWNLGDSGADGDFGPITFNITVQFQAEKGLTVDGEVGPMTWDTAMRADNVTP